MLLIIGMAGLVSNASRVPFLHEPGTALDSLDRVFVYYNGRIGNVKSRNVTQDGYNSGLRWQCVEFVKRYYYDALNHKMPNSYGHAKEFFDPKIKDGHLNPDRNLLQLSNPSSFKPKRGEIIVFDIDPETKRRSFIRYRF